MADKNLTAILRSVGDLRLEETDIPEPKRGEVQLAMHSVGICGSDVKFWQKGIIGVYVVRNPLILGHESSGTVVALGEGVTSLKVGDRVAIEPGVPCMQCSVCMEGRYNLCDDLTFCATPPDDGTLRRFYCHNAKFCHKLPDNMSFEEGAMMEPFSVGVHACRRAQIGPGYTVLITGAGPIGLMVLVAAKAMGATAICITDISESRLEFAKSFGANYTILIDPKDDTEAVADKVKVAMGCLPRVTVECTGVESGLQLGFHATRPGGIVQIVGIGPPDVTIPLGLAVAKEIDIHTNLRYCNDYPVAIELVSSGQVHIKPMVTHRFNLEQTLEAFEMAKSGQAIKCMIECARN
ncbi:sorbitol dehydrogenase isoform X1 [Lingula anatina]|uniref:Sorbitol dehydrogenase n=2 Tax=Lingula anatina TaxID=7574 RepID=A0A1S3JU81_LINAN|nr:sorbitol dehydrogenase isoform X1 [Lingula anatina]|eukprot:XP_013413887.2 sorbitol dehydrogenase isoform X1 [Lingula anatina]